ncbi:hypothetical protein SDRG_08235 [Saprolegnia diclina VS20]|uniref:TNFR-Cys domain-containing protein n=1 Tax=Saprolegnia diclina (strain VS20) TaxID=1156394 RepID=T0Q843_SAPDV|nr:hypothetical protein SDRG_08235 [Saprolegnia diclina VS20]EQC34019.1 hypothetical protein SDRG_08235 [Saprolegnia diclina VS20]|eukprot:XP_008612331.1 hypothetical protein SDRG_08235 [Saprolegnia diclina VS20]
MTRRLFLLLLLHTAAAGLAPRNATHLCTSIDRCMTREAKTCHRGRERCPSCLLPQPETGAYVCIEPTGARCPTYDPPSIDCTAVRRLDTNSTTSRIPPLDPKSSNVPTPVPGPAPPLSTLHIAYIVGISVCTISIFGFLFLYRPASASAKDDVPMLHPPTSSRKMETFLEAFGTNDMLLQSKRALQPIESASPLEARASYFDSVRTSDLLTCARQIPLLEDDVEPKAKTRAASGGGRGTVVIAEETELPKEVGETPSLMRPTELRRQRPIESLMSPYSVGSSESADSVLSDNSEEVFMSRSFSWNKFSLHGTPA